MKATRFCICRKCPSNVLTLLALLVALPLCPLAVAQETPTDEALPSGKEVVERSIQLSGGREVIAKINNRVAEGTMEIKGMGIKGRLTTYYAKPNKTYTEAQIDGIGTITQGCDGEVVWELNPITGPRIKTGKERDTLLLISHMDDTSYSELYEKIECVGIEEVEGQTCYKVVLTPKKAMPLTVFYSKKSGLETKSLLTFPHQMGQVSVESLTTDYKEVDGLKLPYQAIEKAMMLETIVKITSYKHNVELPEDCFSLPPQIKAMLQQEKKKAGETE